MHSVVFFLWSLFTFSTSWAFRLDPMVLPLNLTAPQASGTYTVENNTKTKIAIQFEIRSRVIDPNGKEERPPAEGFVIYPEQLALEPGEKRNIRITWVGESIPQEEKAFRLVASQLPIDFANKETTLQQSVKLKFLIEYVASLYLIPPGAKPKMKVVRQLVKNGNLEILVANQGTAHFLLDKMQVSYKSGLKTGSPDTKTLDELRTENLLAKSERWLRIALPKGFPTNDLTVDIAFDP